MNRPHVRPTRPLNPGALRKGAGGWLLERATAIVLAPLTVWFAASLIAHTGSDHAALVAWLRSPMNSGLMVLLLAVLFWHTALGLGVVIKDYVHATHLKTGALFAMRAACLLSAAAGIGAIVHIALQTP